MCISAFPSGLALPCPRMPGGIFATNVTLMT